MASSVETRERVWHLDEDPTVDPEDGSLSLFLPYSNLRRWIPEGGIYERIVAGFGLARLGHVKCLSELAFNGGQVVEYFSTNHDRLGHSLVVAMLMEEMLLLNGSPLSDVKLGMVSGLLHDRATPALGDPVMAIDQTNLNEEVHWGFNLNRERQALIEALGLRVGDIDKSILGEGLIGSLLNRVADRVTYVTQDLFNIFGDGKRKAYGSSDAGQELYSIIGSDPPLGNIYQDVKLTPDRSDYYFENPERLGRFLLARALLHRHCYLHPASQGRDMVISSLVSHLYSPTDETKLTPRRLREMGDWELYGEIITRYLPAIEVFGNRAAALEFWHPHYQKVDSQEEAQNFSGELNEDGSKVIVGVKKIRGFKTGVDYPVLDGDQVIPFYQANPVLSDRLERVKEETQGWYVIYSDRDVTDSRGILLEQMARDELIGI